MSDLCGILSPKRTIKQQLLYALGGLTLLSLIITIGTSIGLVRSMVSNVESTVTDGLIKQTRDYTINTALETAAIIEQQLLSIGNAVSMTMAKQAEVLLTHPDDTFPYAYKQSFREYNILPFCNITSKCPSDTGPLMGRSRIQVSDLYGSVQASSVYIYDSAVQCAVKTDQDWNLLLSNPDISRAVDRSVYLDDDFKIWYSSANTTVMFYLAAKIPNMATNSYTAIQRVYPAYSRLTPTCDPTTYNPATRGWFTKAIENDLYIYAYQETFTKGLVINFSTKKTIGQSTIVAAALMLLDDIAPVIANAKVLQNGDSYAALIMTDTQEVLLYRNQTSVYIDTENRFMKLGELDQGLNLNNINGLYSYTKSDGTTYYVTQTPIMNNKLTVLIYVRKDDALITLPKLINDIKSSESTINKTLGIIIAVVFGLLAFVVLHLSYVFSVTLPVILSISSQLAKISTKEKKDYTKPIEEVEEHIKKHNPQHELGVLLQLFKQILIKLKKYSMSKNARSIYPENKLYGNKAIIDNNLAAPNFMKNVKSYLPEQPKPSMYDHQPPAYDAVLHEEKKDSSFEYKSANQKPDVIVPLEVESTDTNPVKYDIIGCSLIKRIKYLIPGILLFGMIAIVITSSIIIKSDSKNWMNDTTRTMSQEAIHNLYSTSHTKVRFIKEFLHGTVLEMTRMSDSVTRLLNRPELLTDKRPISYSLDNMNTHVSPISPTTNYSGYFIRNSINCRVQDTCDYYHNSFEVTNTSVLDIPFRSVVYSQSRVDFVQIGLESGLTRVYPYSVKPSYAMPGTQSPPQCLIDSPNPPASCGSCSGFPQSWPPYDPRCRSWYTVVTTNHLKSGTIYFDDPRLASSGKTVITASTPIRKNTDLPLQGVLIFNILTSQLTDAINKLTIMKTGYAFMVNLNNLAVITHPNNKNSGLVYLNSIEKLTSDEWLLFDKLIWTPLNNSNIGNVELTKLGIKYQWVFEPVNIGLKKYGLIIAVPLTEVLETTTIVHSKINSITQTQTIVLIILLLLCTIITFGIASKIAHSVNKPILDMIELAQNILKDDLTKNVKEQINHATSLDTMMLLEAFSSMIISLRFGSESYAQNDLKRSREVFQDALDLYNKMNNSRGVGIAHNNLGAVCVKEKQFEAAEGHYNTAIKQIEEVYNKDKSTSVVKCLSDRLGNLAALKLEQRKYQEAIKILNRAAVLDDASGNLRGLIMKKGTCGKILLLEHKDGPALDMLIDALNIVRRIQLDKTVEKTKKDIEELEVSEQYALLQLGDYCFNKKDYKSAAWFYQTSLTLHKYIDSGLSALAMAGLLRIANTLENHHYYELLEKERNVAGIKIIKDTSVDKNIVFCLDYSGSMSGQRIERAVQNMLLIYDKYITNKDLVGFIRFDNTSKIICPLGPKTAEARNAIAQSIMPTGPTAFRDAVIDAVNCVSNNINKKWIIALTDGEDNSSTHSLDDVCTIVAKSDVSLIIVGIMLNADYTPYINQLVNSSHHGVYINVEQDSAKKLDEAFAKVAEIISSDAQIEAF